MEHYLKVKNFGPLKDVEIDLTNKNLIVLIGPQASGKSTIAKLLGIFYDDTARNYIVNNDIQSSSERFWGEFKAKMLPEQNHMSTIEFKDSDIGIIDDKTSYSVNGHHYGNDFLYVINTLEKYIQRIASEVVSDKKTSLFNWRIANDFALRSYRFIVRAPHIPLLETLVDVKMAGEVFSLLKTFNDNDQFHEINKQQLFDGYIFVLETLRQISNRLKLVKETFPLSIYIPAERGSTHLFEFSIHDPNSSPLPEYLKEFLQNLKEAASNQSIQELKPLNISYRNIEGVLFLEINGVSVSINQSSSGYQAIFPLSLVVEHLAQSGLPYTFIIEEPELNLYPSTQKKLVEFLVEKCTKNGNKLIITTHSPYILTAISNAIKAGEVAKQEGLHNDVDKIIPEQYWLNYENVGAYYVADGTAKDIMDPEYRTIKSAAIDDVSESLSADFDSLLELQYRDK